MVQNLGMLKSGRADAARRDVDAVVRAAPGMAVKVILETGALADEEKRLACRLGTSASATILAGLPDG